MMLGNSLRAIIASVAALGWVIACDDSSSSEGGDTHWLGACERDDQCRTGACWCGLCTRRCSGDDACTESRTACFESRSPGLTERCDEGSLPEGSGICLGLCSANTDCSSGSECLLGACVPRSSDSPDGGSAGGSSGGSKGGAGGANSGAGGRRSVTDAGVPRATDYADVMVPVDFTNPVVVPPPETAITGDASRFAGKWVNLSLNPNLHGARCSAAAKPSEPCYHLEIAGGPNGGLIGTVRVDPRSTDVSHGPYPAPTDPGVGYPPDVPPSDYFALRSNYNAATYTLFDGIVQGGELEFWTSQSEIWTGWCALQQPIHWDLDGKNAYRCVPQTATTSNTDLGKLVLCSTAWDGPHCESASGTEFPCSCLDDQMNEMGTPECVFYSPICECSTSECHAAVRTTQDWSRLRVVGETLVGPLLTNPFGPLELTLVKETP